MKRSGPRHVAIVMDGNGRWALKRGLDRIEGHKKGAKVALDIVRHAGECGVQYLTLYTFSSENWRRPKSEVSGLMNILHEHLLKEANSLVENGVRLRTIGDESHLPAHVQTALKEVKALSAHCDKVQLILALSYGARDEIVRACRQIAALAKAGQLEPNDINEASFSNFLDTKEIPDPDIFIRTSGENRLSNFLLWQSSYSELFFSQVLWPDFQKSDFDQVLAEYAQRERRYGTVLSNE